MNNKKNHYEVRDAILNLKNGKSSGIGNIPSELLKRRRKPNKNIHNIMSTYMENKKVARPMDKITYHAEYRKR